MSDLIINSSGGTLKKEVKPAYLYKLRVRVDPGPVVSALGFREYRDMLVTLPGGIETNVFKSYGDAVMALRLQRLLRKFRGASFQIVKYLFSEVPRDEIHLKIPETNKDSP